MKKPIKIQLKFEVSDDDPLKDEIFKLFYELGDALKKNKEFEEELAEAKAKLGRVTIGNLDKVLNEKYPDIHEEVEEYEMRGDDGDYTPNENERFLMEDFTIGIMENFTKDLATALVTAINEGSKQNGH